MSNMPLNPNVAIEAPADGKIALSLGTGQDVATGQPRVALMIEVPIGTFVFLIDEAQADWAAKHLTENAAIVRAQKLTGQSGIIVPGLVPGPSGNGKPQNLRSVE